MDPTPGLVLLDSSLADESRMYRSHPAWVREAARWRQESDCHAADVPVGVA